MAQVYCCKYVWNDTSVTPNKKYYLRKCNTVQACSQTITELGHTWALDQQTRAADCAHCWDTRETPSAFLLGYELNEVRVRLAEIQGRLAVLARLGSSDAVVSPELVEIEVGEES